MQISPVLQSSLESSHQKGCHCSLFLVVSDIMVSVKINVSYCNVLFVIAWLKVIDYPWMQSCRLFHLWCSIAIKLNGNFDLQTFGLKCDQNTFNGMDHCSGVGNAAALETYQYNDVIMSAMAFQITSLTIVYSIVYSGADQRAYQSSASQTFVRGIHRQNGL